MVNRRNTLINYDRLADAIVAAQKRAEEKEDESNEKKEKIKAKDFFKSVGLIITNKTETNGTMISGLFGLLISAFFNLLAILGAFAFAVALIYLAWTAYKMDWNLNSLWMNILSIILLAMSTVLIGLFSLILRASANEISNEKDRNYVVNVFAGLTSFLALIVAVIALYKGIN